jgi:diacylglycerol kinase family enzyme
VHREHDLAELTLRSTRPVAVQVDGEPLGELDTLLVRSVPGALRVVV